MPDPTLNGSRPRLNDDDLTPEDFERAEQKLGIDPWSLETKTQRVILSIWCLLSRDNPELTWDEAKRTPFGRFDMSGDEPPPPPAAPPGSPGREGEPSPASGSSRKQRAAAPAPS